MAKRKPKVEQIAEAYQQGRVDGAAKQAHNYDAGHSVGWKAGYEAGKQDGWKAHRELNDRELGLDRDVIMWKNSRRSIWERMCHGKAH